MPSLYTAGLIKRRLLRCTGHLAHFLMLTSNVHKLERLCTARSSMNGLACNLVDAAFEGGLLLRILESTEPS